MMPRLPVPVPGAGQSFQQTFANNEITEKVPTLLMVESAYFHIEDTMKLDANQGDFIFLVPIDANASGFKNLCLIVS